MPLNTVAATVSVCSSFVLQKKIDKSLKIESKLWPALPEKLEIANSFLDPTCTTIQLPIASNFFRMPPPP